MQDLLVCGGTVITMDPARRVLTNGAVLIRGNRIVAVGDVAELRAAYPDAAALDASAAAILPGLIDAHGHAGHCLVRCIAESVRTAAWNPVMERIYFHSTTPDFWRAEARLAALERLKFGVTTGVSITGGDPRCDDPIYAGGTAEGYTEVGTRVIVAVGPTYAPWPRQFTSWTSGAPRAVEVTFEQAIQTVAAALHRWHQSAGGRVLVYPSPAGLMPSFSASGRTFDALHPPVAQPIDHAQAKALLQLAEEYDTGIHTHAYGGMFKAAFDGDVDCLNPRYSVAHCTGISVEEIRIIADAGLHVVHGPMTRRNVAERCPVVELLDAGVNVVFGTDGTAPDRSFDILEKLRFGMWLQRSHFHDPGLLPAGKALAMVTVDAAKALGLSDLGSIEPDKLADLTIIDLRKPHLAPIAMVPQQIAYRASGQDVDTVIVDGKVRMRHRQVVGINEDDILADATAQMWETVERAGVQEHMALPEDFWGLPGGAGATPRSTRAAAYDRV
ncbi:MAG: amidohydrolase family protein [Planctomycetes bacterium]|nr:amidohydrolase family protein [Planctomycetota bacterium]